MRIRTKLIVAFLAIATVSVATGYFGLDSMAKVNNSFNVLHFQAVPLVDALKNAKVAALNVSAYTKEIILERDANVLALRMDLIAQEKSQFTAALDQYSELTRTHFPGQEHLADEIVTEWEKFESSSDRVMQTVDVQGAAFVIAQGEFARSEETLLASIDTAIISAEKNVSNEETVFASSLNNADYAIIVIVLTSVSITLAILVLVTSSLSKPLTKLRHAVHEISKGNFDVHIETRRDDEMGELAVDVEKMKEELKEKDRLKEEFINIAAHELRTPVLPIILTSEDLADEIDADKSDKVNVILRNAKRLKKLTDDILDVSRIESNTFKLNKSRTNMVNLVQDIVHDARSRIQSSQKVNIIFQPKLSEKYEILVDREKIRQVITNLISNAVDFTDSGTITVVLQENGAPMNSIELEVIDTGKGIDESVKDRLFQKFVTKSNKAKGTGLGLYLSKAIVEAHGGKISGENNKDGKGATFAFTLPVDDLQPPQLEDFALQDGPAANKPEYLKHYAEYQL